jgi:hypothetical protein
LSPIFTPGPVRAKNLEKFNAFYVQNHPHSVLGPGKNYRLSPPLYGPEIYSFIERNHQKSFVPNYPQFFFLEKIRFYRDKKNCKISYDA